jgi:ribonuclease BN (tRNA processing enzyme)
MKLTIVGCSGSFPGPDAAASSYLVEADGFRLVLDLGNGALGALQRHVELDDIDAVLLSHLHSDHCMDLCSFYVARKYDPEGRFGKKLPVYGPAGSAERMARAYYDANQRGGLDDVYDFQTLSPGTLAIGPFDVTVARVNHPVETFASRLEHAGRALAFSADTGESNALVSLAVAADLLLCEATFSEGPDNARNLHLTARQAAEHAARAGVDRLMLTHIPPWNDKQRSLEEASNSSYSGAVDLARPGAIVEV